MMENCKIYPTSRLVFAGAFMFMASVAAATPVGSLASNSANVNREVFVNSSTQQAKLTVSGIVEDLFGPVAGANIVEQGTTNGTITDMDGKFTLVVSPKSTLIVSFIGYK